MSNGQVIGIVEIIPINYKERTSEEKNYIISNYIKFLRTAPDNLHCKVRTEKADVNSIIASIMKSNKEEKDPRVLAQMNDNIKNIKSLQSKETYSKKFYIIYEYEGDNEGRKSIIKEEIIQTMMETRWSIINSFKNIGNVIVMPSTAREVLTQPLEAVYKHFNPRSSHTEPFYLRLMRLQHDEENYNETHEKAREIQWSDYVAQRGFKLLKNNTNMLLSDGMYHTYLSINDNGYPEGEPGVEPGWILSLLDEYDDVDIDVISRKQPHDITVELLEQSKKLTRNFADQKKNNPDKATQLYSKVDHLRYVIDCMKADEDLYKVMTIITVRAKTVKNLKLKTNAIRKKLSQNSVYVSSSYYTRIPFFKMTMPFMYIDTLLFNKYAHDFLTSSLASFYWYFTYQLLDEDGYVLGINVMNSTLVAINNFLKKYVNPHMLLLGMPGAGKTFLELMLGYRMRLTGIRCIYIIPAKATLDYYKATKNISGSFISMGPGKKDCINFMAIRPQDSVKTDKTSLLSRKINFVTRLIEMQMGEEKLSNNEMISLKLLLTNLYKQYGITDDDNSIYRKGTKELKDMPVPEDLYNYLLDEPDLKEVAKMISKFVTGNCKNMNQQTNVDLDNKFIVFDIDEESMSKEEFDTFMFIAYDCANTIAKRSKHEKVAIFLDEVWKAMKNIKTAELTESMVLLLRAYSTAIVMASQNIEHFLNAAGTTGKSVVSNPAIRILLKMSDTELKTVEKYISLSWQDKERIMSFDTGNGMVIANNDKVWTYFKASEKELEVFSSDDIEE